MLTGAAAYVLLLLIYLDQKTALNHYYLRHQVNRLPASADGGYRRLTVLGGGRAHVVDYRVIQCDLVS